MGARIKIIANNAPETILISEVIHEQKEAVFRTKQTH